MRGVFALLVLTLLFAGCTPPKVPIPSVPPLSCDTPPQIGWSPDTQRIVATARRQLGTPYRYGGMQPYEGFDCSGFVCYVYLEALGKKIPRTASAQSRYVERLPRSALKPGDLLFFDTRYGGRGRVNHCGIYLGGGTFIHASSGKVHSVTISPLDRGFYRNCFKWGGRVRRYR